MPKFRTDLYDAEYEKLATKVSEHLANSEDYKNLTGEALAKKANEVESLRSDCQSLYWLIESAVKEGKYDQELQSKAHDLIQPIQSLATALVNLTKEQ